MAHEIDQSNGQDNMAHVGEVPWHGLGQRLDEDADIDTWKKQAGMDWRVGVAPVEFAGAEVKTSKGHGPAFEMHKFADRNVLYRDDTKAGLGIVSQNYKIVHPGEVLEFFRDLIKGHGFKLETAGCLFGGKKFWALARTGKTVKFMREDKLDPYLLLATSCDGSMATAVHPTSVRVVCNNTLRWSIGDGSNAKIRVPHSAIFNPDSVREQLGEIDERWQQFLTNAQRLVDNKMDHDAAIQVIADELKKEWRNAESGELMEQEEMMASSHVLRSIIRLYDGDGKGSTYRTSKNTAWGLVNAATEYFDHHAGQAGGDPSRRFERAHLTDRSRFKTNIANRLLGVGRKAA